MDSTGEVVLVDIRMFRQSTRTGIVRDLSDQPAEGAVVLASPRNMAVFDPVEGTVSDPGHGSKRMKTDGEGVFSGSVPYGLSYLIIRHPTGFAFESVHADEQAPEKPIGVQLKSWASIHGLMGARLASAQAVIDGVGGHESVYLDFDLSKTRIVDGNSFDWPFVPPLLTTSIYINGPNGSKLGGNGDRLYPGEAREIDLRLISPRAWAMTGGLVFCHTDAISVRFGACNS